MKKILFFLSFFLYVGLSAQNLSLNELIALRRMELADAENFLTNKGWHYKEGTAPDGEKLGVALFVYRPKSDYKQAESFIAYYYQEDGTRRLSIQIHTQAKYLEYLAGVNKFAPSPLNTKIKEGSLVKIYVGSTTTFHFITTARNNGLGSTGSVWKLYLVENSDYESGFGYN